MTKYGGYAGKILRVDLSKEKISSTEVTDEFARNFIGGNGFAAKILYDEMTPGIDPLGPENLYSIMTGPAAGTLLPCAGRANVHTKSPLTGYFFDSSGGGNFAPEIKYAGFDGIVVKGRASRPSYIWINDGNVEIRDASHLWGMKTSQLHGALVKELGDTRIQTASTGPAGEKLVRITGTMFGVNAAGRGGSGAVLGSKNLKAIVVRGTGSVSVPSKKDFMEYIDMLNEKISATPGSGEILPKYGTLATTLSNNRMGVLPTKNWQHEHFDEAEGLGGDYMRDNVFAKHKACHACPIACSKYTYVSTGPYAGTFTKGPEYQTAYGLGTCCANSSMESVIKANELCQDYGLDTISTGVTIAFAMECWERGILKKKDTGGLEPDWGNDAAVVKLVEMIGEREGIGDILAEGSRIAAQKIGKDSIKFAVQNRGCEIAGHSARGNKGFALGYATGPRGGSHHDGRASLERSGTVDRRTIEGKAEYQARINHLMAFTDSLIACHMLEGVFSPYDVDELAVGYLNAATGMGMTLEEGQLAAERIWNLERAFNVREGLRRKDDWLPERFVAEAVPDGPSEGMMIHPDELNRMLDEYYEFRGWDKETGVPTKSRLKKLGLDSIADEMGV
ncbi:MAG: aldehyde ferredoxin oxidoreductase family protein [Candidatus Thorarchaeota archaeon]|jgi:aldehyde:ferredoxin oxidoreductase